MENFIHFNWFFAWAVFTYFSKTWLCQTIYSPLTIRCESLGRCKLKCLTAVGQLSALQYSDFFLCLHILILFLMYWSSIQQKEWANGKACHMRSWKTYSFTFVSRGGVAKCEAQNISMEKQVPKAAQESGHGCGARRAQASGQRCSQAHTDHAASTTRAARWELPTQLQHVGRGRDAFPGWFYTAGCTLHRWACKEGLLLLAPLLQELCCRNYQPGTTSWSQGKKKQTMWNVLKYSDLYRRGLFS